MLPSGVVVDGFEYPLVIVPAKFTHVPGVPFESGASCNATDTPENPFT